MQTEGHTEGHTEGSNSCNEAEVLGVQATPVKSSSNFSMPPMKSVVEVVAPADLAGGYQFNVDSGTSSLLVQVPDGGVRAGQRFNAIIVKQNESMVMSGGHNIPSGRWRDDLCDCCAFGCCHPLFCLTCWCSGCALGQVLTRMKLNWCACPINRRSPCMAAFWVLFIITTVRAVLALIFLLARVTGGFIFIVLIYFIIVVVITVRARGYLRKKYQIREEACMGCEDCCCGFWCNWCTICQMARHTADYEKYNAGCCAATGLATGAPEVV